MTIRDHIKALVEAGYEVMGPLLPMKEEGEVTENDLAWSVWKSPDGSSFLYSEEVHYALYTGARKHYYKTAEAAINALLTRNPYPETY